jgi:uncharacterized protein (DUF1778 family)
MCLDSLKQTTMSANSKRKQQPAYKVERLEARISPQEKAIFAKAAAVQGRTLSEFVVSSLHDAASRVIESYEIIRLAEQDREAFINALLNPPEPSENLRAAAKRYLKRQKMR